MGLRSERKKLRRERRELTGRMEELEARRRSLDAQINALKEERWLDFAAISRHTLNQRSNESAVEEWQRILSNLSSKTAHEAAVDGYLHLVKTAATAGDPAVFQALREARLFEIHPASADRLMGEVDAYEESIPEVPFEALPFPEHLPFPSCLFIWGVSVPSCATVRSFLSAVMGLGGPIHVEPEQLGPTQRKLFGISGPELDKVAKRWVWQDGLVGAWTVAVLVTADGEVVEFLEPPHPEPGTSMAIRYRSGIFSGGVGWAPWASLVAMPWLVAALVGAVNDADTAIVEGERTLTYRRKFEKQSKLMGKGKKLLPRPFYTVDLRPTTQTVRRQIRKSIPRDWSHRWDVRGHWVTRVLGGMLPIDEKLMRQLARRGYWVFSSVRPPTGEVVRILMRHRLPLPTLDTWVAVQQVWRGHFVKGPEDKPYIPSSHRLPRSPK